MADRRTPLPIGSIIILNNDRYCVNDIIGCGSSCLAYSASRKPNQYEQSIGMPPTPAVIKEFYPDELGVYIRRDGMMITIPAEKRSLYDELRSRFERGAVNQALFFIKDSDHSFAPTRIADANNTVYSIVDSVQGDILQNIRTELDMYEIAQIIQSLCYAVKELHDDGKLHLDIKPSNIFLFNKDSCESRRIALFDFDTVTPLDELETSVIPFSEGWSPNEQIYQRREKISYASDIYAIGAVSYWLLTGEKVTTALLDDIKRKRFEFFDKIEVLINKQSPREQLKWLLGSTLKRDPAERSQKVEDLLK